MLQSLQSQADADDDPAAEEARAEKEEAPGSWMILDVHWCIGALVQKHKTRTPWACRGMQGAQRNHGQSKAGTTSFAGQRSNVATACNCYFFLGGIRKLISALKVLDVLKRLGQDHLYIYIYFYKAPATPIRQA